MDLNTSTLEAGRSGDRGEEGKATRAIERRTSRAPSGIFLALAIGSMAASAVIMLTEKTRFGGRWMGGRRSGLANFVGQWAPTLLIMGVYNKVVKLEKELTGMP
ncbi:MAG TPA: hypothetical protein VK540_24235 [Polyangiaceae bacterium]|nr:hypothetical protein [Polyangiaceae bacterium]